jgi:hypothetical protein
MLGAPASRFWDLGQHEPQLRSTNSCGHSTRPLSKEKVLAHYPAKPGQRHSMKIFAQDRSRRSASGVGTNWSYPRIAAASSSRVRPRHQSRQALNNRRQRMSWRTRSRREPGERRTGRRRGQHRRRAGRHYRSHLHGHRAVMRSVPPAARQQTRLVAGLKHPRQGP